MHRIYKNTDRDDETKSIGMLWNVLCFEFWVNKLQYERCFFSYCWNVKGSKQLFQGGKCDVGMIIMLGQQWYEVQRRNNFREL